MKRVKKWAELTKVVWTCMLQNGRLVNREECTSPTGESNNEWINLKSIGTQLGHGIRTLWKFFLSRAESQSTEGRQLDQQTSLRRSNSLTSTRSLSNWPTALRSKLTEIWWPIQVPHKFTSAGIDLASSRTWHTNKKCFSSSTCWPTRYLRKRLDLSMFFHLVCLNRYAAGVES